MKKLTVKEKLKVAAVACIMAMITMFVLMFGCKAPEHPLSKAVHPCECVYKGWDYEIHFQCQDSLYKFRDERYYREIDEREIIKQSFK